MTHATQDNTTGLEQAFRLFTEMSGRMETSYRALQEQVARLNSELRAARSERFRQLQEKERLANRLERLLDALPGGVLVVDARGVVRECNPAARELLGEPLVGEPWPAMLERLAAPDGWQGSDLELRDGRTLSIGSRSLGSEPGRIVLIHDTSETRHLRELLNRQQSLAAMGEMTARLAHQVRTPLASSMLYASQLQQPDLSSERRHRCADRMLSCLRQLEHEVNDMLLFARGGQFEMQTVDLGALATALNSALGPQLAVARVRLRTRGMAGRTLHGNHEALLGALTNLITNAMQAGASVVRVGCAEHAGGDLKLTVVDNGPGVPPGIRSRIFEPFFTSRPQGTGLGLAVAQAVVQAHGGRIELAPSARGTRFVLSFPPRNSAEALSSGASSPAAAGRSKATESRSHL